MLKSLFIAVSALLFVVSAAHAEKKELIKVTAESFPGEYYSIGVNTNDVNDVDSIYYEDTFQKKAEDRLHTFPGEQLLSGVLLKERDGHELIKLSMVEVSSQNYAVDLDYLSSGVGGDHRGHVYLGFRFNHATGSYEVFYKGTEKSDIAKTDGRIVSSANVKTRYLTVKLLRIKKEIGIASIDFN